MKLPESLLWCFYPDCDLSGVQIYCEDDLKATIIEEFTELFWEKYEDEVKGIMEDEDQDPDDYEDNYEFGEESEPIGEVFETDEGVFIEVGNLSVFDTWDNGDNCIEECVDALKDTLSELYDKYPDIEIEGYVGYCWSDEKDGAAVQFDIAYPGKLKKPKAYDFVGETLDDAFLDDKYLDEFYDQYCEVISVDYDELIEVILNHREWISDEAIENFVAKFEEESDFEDLFEDED